MKSVLTFILTLFLAFTLRSEAIYFWLDNSDMRYSNLENSFTAFLQYTENGETVKVECDVRKAMAKDVGASGNRDARISDFGNIDSIDGVTHWLEEGIGSNGKKSIVYRMDLGGISVEDYTSMAFLIELDSYNGTNYYGEFLASELTNHFYTKDLAHICGGITMQTIPEPNSILLVLIGFGLLGLKRKTKYDKSGLRRFEYDV